MWVSRFSGLVEWNGILESEILIINTCHVMGIKSVIASNNCINSDAGIYNMHQCDAVKVDVAAL